MGVGGLEAGKSDPGEYYTTYIENVKSDISTYLTGVLRLIKQYYEQPHTTEFDKPNEKYTTY